MAKSQDSKRETKKPKAEAKPKTKVAKYMTGDTLSSAKPAPFKMPVKK